MIIMLFEMKICEHLCFWVGLLALVSLKMEVTFVTHLTFEYSSRGDGFTPLHLSRAVTHDSPVTQHFLTLTSD